MGGFLTSWCASKRSSIALAPRRSTGRSSLRYTFSVVRVFAWPTRCAMSSIGMPALDSSETKLCRSSRGVHSSARSPACSATWRKARRTFAASRGVPSLVVKQDHCRAIVLRFACESGSASVCALEARFCNRSVARECAGTVASWCPRPPGRIATAARLAARRPRLHGSRSALVTPPSVRL